MSFVDLLKQPWFYHSPSPWSLAFYVILTLYGIRLLAAVQYKHKRAAIIFRTIDAFSIVAIIVLLQDSLWLAANTVRFYSEYSEFMGISYWLCYARNFTAAFVFFILASDTYGRYWKFNKKTLGMFALYAGFIGFVAFGIAYDPALMDWTYAIRYGYSDDTILAAFLLSHVIGKLLIFCIYKTVWIKRN